jgi:hypothetical protein
LSSISSLVSIPRGPPMVRMVVAGHLWLVKEAAQSDMKLVT